MVREALLLEPENEEAKGLHRELMGDESCRRKEMRLQVRVQVSLEAGSGGTPGCCGRVELSGY